MTVEYEIRVAGLVPADLLVEIEGVRVVVEPVARVLRVAVANQAALHGVINRLQTSGDSCMERERALP